MDLRSGPSADRRRRLLREEPAGADAEATPRRRTRTRVDAAHYPEAALPHRQPRITDLLPLKWWTLGLSAAGGTLVAVAILVGFAYHGFLASILGDEALRPIDLTRPGNLADWFASWTLLATAFVAGVIFLLRRHRNDDYRGRYRVWLWTALATLTAAVDAASGLHQALSGALVAATGLSVEGNGAVWSLLLGGLGSAIVFAALVREFLCCRPALSALAVAAFAYAGFAAATFYRVETNGATGAWLIQEGLRLFGCLAFAVAVLIYARHVLREVQGLSKSVRRKRRTKSEAGDDAGESRVPAPHFRRKPTAAKSTAGAGSSASTSSGSPRPERAAAPTTAAVASSAPSKPTSEASVKPSPTPARPTAPEASRTAPSVPSPAKPAAPASDVRRVDSPQKSAGPLANKFRAPGASPAPATVAKPNAAPPSPASTDEDDDGNDSRRNKKRRR